MTSPAPTLIDRYQDYRVRRYLKQESQFAGMLAGWRTQHRRRLLVIAVITGIAMYFCAGLAVAIGGEWAAIGFLPAVALSLPAWGMLRIVSARQDDAPAQALDEREIAQRNAARSLGLTITQTLTMFPLGFLIVVGVVAPEADAFRTAYAGGAMAVATLLAGGCAPAMILGWTQPDPEPDTFDETA